uniref:Uncharacterized protein n=1 Tax=Timema bartmani TaxID=61472 RepID=A0A7R9HXU9_9NEOP|nr:unnamed protein product [Timema bartmani]
MRLENEAQYHKNSNRPRGVVVSAPGYELKCPRARFLDGTIDIFHFYGNHPNDHQSLDWFSRQQLVMLVLFVNISLAIMFFKLLT